MSGIFSFLFFYVLIFLIVFVFSVLTFPSFSFVSCLAFFQNGSQGGKADFKIFQTWCFFVIFLCFLILVFLVFFFEKYFHKIENFSYNDICHPTRPTHRTTKPNTPPHNTEPPDNPPRNTKPNTRPPEAQSDRWKAAGRTSTEGEREGSSRPGRRWRRRGGRRERPS